MVLDMFIYGCAGIKAWNHFSFTATGCRYHYWWTNNGYSSL